MNSVIAQCYRQYDQSAPFQNSLGVTNLQGTLRRCVEIDYLAYKDNQVLTNRGLRGDPYLSMGALDARWGHYGMAAGFQNPEQMFEYARAGYAIAEPVVVDAMRNSRGFQMPAPHQATGSFGF